MKITKSFYLPLLVLLGAFSSCSPDSEEVSPSASMGQDAKAKPTAAAKESLTISLTFSNNPTAVGSEVTVFSDVTVNPNEGVIRIQRAIDASGNYTTVALATDWETVDEETVTPTDNMASYTYTPDAVGMFGFRSQYIPKGGSGYGAVKTTADLEVIATCTEKLSLMGEATATQISGSLYRIEATYTIAACENMAALKLQGGITAHSSYNEAIPTASATRETGNGNVVTTWEGINMMGGTTKTYKSYLRERTEVSWHAHCNRRLVCERQGWQQCRDRSKCSCTNCYHLINYSSHKNPCLNKQGFFYS